MDEIIDFKNKRFPTDCKWLRENSYYFAVILKARFPAGRIYFDVSNSHFCFRINDKYYDWNGIYVPFFPVNWEYYSEFDPSQYTKITCEYLA